MVNENIGPMSMLGDKGYFLYTTHTDQFFIYQDSQSTLCQREDNPCVYPGTLNKQSTCTLNQGHLFASMPLIE